MQDTERQAQEEKSKPQGRHITRRQALVAGLGAAATAVLGLPIAARAIVNAENGREHELTENIFLVMDNAAINKDFGVKRVSFRQQKIYVSGNGSRTIDDPIHTTPIDGRLILITGEQVQKDNYYPVPAPVGIQSQFVFIPDVMNKEFHDQTTFAPFTGGNESLYRMTGNIMRGKFTFVDEPKRAPLSTSGMNLTSIYNHLHDLDPKNTPTPQA